MPSSHRRDNIKKKSLKGRVIYTVWDDVAPLHTKEEMNRLIELAGDTDRVFSTTKVCSDIGRK